MLFRLPCASLLGFVLFSMHTTKEFGLEFFKPGTEVLFLQQRRLRSFQMIPVWGAGTFISTQLQGQVLHTLIVCTI